MKKFTFALTLTLVIVSSSIPAFGWGATGHKTVGQIAQLRLANTNTLTRIRQILRQGETLASVSNWADTVKEEEMFMSGTVHPDLDTQHFYRRPGNKRNRVWHFVNLPLGCTSYQQCPSAFKSQTDIVQQINRCIRKLRGGNDPDLTPRNALRMLVHLVGDIHQPLHVGIGFVNTDGPDNTIVFEHAPMVILANDLPRDNGGNLLLLRGEDTDNLHSFWDSELVEDARGNQSVFQFATSLNVEPQPGWNAQGDASTWSSQWAADTLLTSKNNAYPTIRIRREVIIDDDTKYLISKGGNYGSNNVPVVKLQLAKGGYRLAKLLQAILP